MPRSIPQFNHRPRTRADEMTYRRQAWRLADKRFYSSHPWVTLREFKLQQDPLCEACLKRGRSTLATDVHHLADRKSHPELSLDFANLMSLCKACHNSMRRK